ncbi:TRAP transporter large permease [Pseudorhizobium halotolerans]|uniref:TRAP transporter large permease protein n=1 Tax=Pseudorhizobium halotolerans TaxID=1233081 RepID=A0ABN7JXP8_9HYPH|nr:TRAP transporter large permease [Pseudorhizobium halotolerans]CAD7053329.1 TRAP transporter large permease [Pseudorhizobium halotolerans]
MPLISLSFIVLLALSVPIAVILGSVAMWGLSNFGVPPVTVLQSALESLDSFSLMAVPFYILAGNIMQSGGIARRLVGLANALIGWVRGGLGAAAVLTSMFFATISGSSSATAAAVGAITIPAMEKKGYPRNFAAATVASAGELGAIIPPSLPMIIYALVTGVSVGDMFIAGIIPGVMIGLTIILTVIVVANIRGFDSITPVTPRIWIRNVLTSLRDAGPALLMPILILGGIYSGFFTPTEAAVVAVVYGLIVSILLYRELTLSMLAQVLIRSALTSSGLLLIVAFASGFGFFLTIMQVPQEVSRWLLSFADSPIMFLLLVNLLLLVVGMFMETLAAIIILAPILTPIAAHFGIDPLHFGMLMIVNLATGMVTPPVGVNLFVVCEVAKLRIDQLMRPLAIFLVVLVTNIAIISYVPIISTILVR